jgi:hypothetical protein
MKGTLSPENEGFRDPHRPVWLVLGGGVLVFLALGAAMVYVAGALGWAGVVITAAAEAAVIAGLLLVSKKPFDQP